MNLFVPGDGRVTAVRLTDGRPSWVADLSTELAASGQPAPFGWRVLAGRKTVLAVPTEAIAEQPVASVARATIRSFALLLNLGRLPALAAGGYDAWAARAAPVFALDPETGRVLRRLDFVANGPTVAAHLGPEVAVIVTAGRAYWLK